MTLDRYCILKACAEGILEDYGLRAYITFVRNNPKARLSRKTAGKALKRFKEYERKHGEGNASPTTLPGST